MTDQPQPGDATAGERETALREALARGANRQQRAALDLALWQGLGTGEPEAMSLLYDTLRVTDEPRTEAQAGA